MSTIRALEARLRAWKSFRGIASAARTLAAAQSLRWSTRGRDAARHLAWCAALAADLAPSPAGAARVPVLIAVGTDLGLCGRLNRLVADAAQEVLRARAPALSVAVGQRLHGELRDLPGLVALPAPTSFAAVQALAGRLERLLRALAPPTGLDLLLVLASHTLPSGTPVVVTWSGAPPLEDGAHVAPLLARPRAELTPAEHLRAPAAGLLLHARIVHALCVAQASEAAARLQAMSRAVEQSDRRIADQERLVRKVHQEATTQEMLEVLGGRRSVAAAWRRAPRGRDSGT